MPEKKLVKVKVKKKKINFRKTILILLFFYLSYFFIQAIVNSNIKNIYIKNNNYIKDVEILELAKITNYPSFYLTRSNDMKNNILKNDYVKNVKINKQLFGQLYIEIEEKKPLFINQSNLKIIVETGEELENIYNIDYVPYLMDSVDSEIYDYFIEQFNLVDSNVLLKISEIYYRPLIVDNSRFLLYMNDGNLVYITLSKIELLNNYNQIVLEFDGKRGILNLDSGNYFDVKEEVDV